MSKENTYYFKHDYNARNDRKMIRVKLKYKMAGIGIFWCIVEMLFEENGKIPLTEIPVIAGDLREKEITISSIIMDFDLFKNDGVFFWSDSVNRRLEKRLELSEKAKASAHERWRNANGMRTHSERYAIKENKRKENKRRNTPLPDEPATLFSEFVKSYFEFYNSKTGIDPKFNGAEGKNMADLVKYFRCQAKKKNEALTDNEVDEKAKKYFDYVLKNWNALSEFLQNQIDIKSINSQINRIISELKTLSNSANV